MNWHHRSTVEKMKFLIEGLFVPDPSSSLVISRSGIGALGLGDDIYWDFVLKLLPQLSGGYITTTDQEKGLVVALREAISEMSLPGYVRVETIDENSWRLGRLHGMRRVRYEKSVSERCMIAFVKSINFFIRAWIGVYINPHFFAAAGVLVIAALLQNSAIDAVTAALIVLAVTKDKDWRSLQKRRLASWVEKREGWPESETDYKQKLCDICNDPDRWAFTRAIVQFKISQRLVGSLVNRYYKWNESRRPGIRLERMRVANLSP